MAIAQLHFNLDNEDDAMTHKQMLKAKDALNALLDMAVYMRAELKYKKAPDNLEEARKNFYSILNGYDINLDELLE